MKTIALRPQNPLRRRPTGQSSNQHKTASWLSTFSRSKGRPNRAAGAHLSNPSKIANCRLTESGRSRRAPSMISKKRLIPSASRSVVSGTMRAASTWRNSAFSEGSDLIGGSLHAPSFTTLGSTPSRLFGWTAIRPDDESAKSRDVERPHSRIALPDRRINSRR